MANKRSKFYGVHKGRRPGVYTDWESCRAQVERCPNQFRGFQTYDEAAFYVATGRTSDSGNRTAPVAERRHTQRPGISANAVWTDRRPQIKAEPLDASQSYFSQVPDFKPDVKADFDEEFGRFASSQGVQPGSRAWRQTRTDAIRHEMIFHYSQAVDPDDKGDVKREDKDDICLSQAERAEKTNLQVYQNMCREVNLEPLDTVEGCVANLKGVLVNIVDYLDARRTGRPVKVWDPYEFEEFRRYTLSPQKRIDLEEAKGGILEPLLQVLRSAEAARVYQDRQYRAVRARRESAGRVWSRVVDQKPRRRPEVIKEEPGTPLLTPKMEHDVVSIRGVESRCSPPVRPVKEVKEEPRTPLHIPNREHDIISIHGTESECSSPIRPAKEEVVEVCPWSPSSIGSSIVEILTIHGTEPGRSSPVRPVKEEVVEVCPWSPNSVGSSVVEILISTQASTKRTLDDFFERKGATQDETALTGTHKRTRL